MSDAEDEAQAKAQELGVQTHHEHMENGEFRFRLVADDGSSYIRAVAGPSGAWQSSHFHTSIQETCIVQSGWAALVEYRDARMVWHILRPGDVRTTVPGIPHNVYLPATTVLHTVKHGHGGDADWHAYPSLDTLTTVWSEQDIVQVHFPQGQ